MRIRKLQCQDENAEWYTDGYACEVMPHLVLFRYDPKAWGRIGAFYGHKIRKAHATLKDLEDIVYPTRDLQWLPIEILTVNQIKALDKRCRISAQTLKQFLSI